MEEEEEKDWEDWEEEDKKKKSIENIWEKKLWWKGYEAKL